MSARRAQLVLAGVVALQLVAETALTPYWPLLFRRLFGIEELAATGSYLTICRVAGLVALPLWGLAALRWPVRTLLATGLAASAVFDLTLALAPTWWLFTASSAGVVATGSVLVLAYPALIAVTERPGEVDRRTGVVTYWAVFHTSVVAATLIGAVIVLLEEPRLGLAAFALVDLALAAAVWLFVPTQPAHSVRRREASASGIAPTATAPGRPAAADHWRQLRPWLVLVVAVVILDAAMAVSRPYFVELLLRGGVDAALAGWLFLVPGLASLVVLPFAGRLLDRLGSVAAPLAAGLAATGLVVQAVAADQSDIPTMVLGRVLLGLGAGVLLVALDLVVFDRIGTNGAAFGALETGRSGALLVAPVLATVVSATWLGAPLLLAAALFLVAGGLMAPAQAGSAPRPVPLDHRESSDDLDPVH